MLKKLWDYSGWIVGAYTIYSHLKTLNTVREELYSSLDPEQQRRLESLVGKVKTETSSLFNQPLAILVPAPAPTLTQVKAGA